MNLDDLQKLSDDLVFKNREVIDEIFKVTDLKISIGTFTYHLKVIATKRLKERGIPVTKDAETDEYKYRKGLMLKFAVDAESVKYIVRNGVLEIFIEIIDNVN